MADEAQPRIRERPAAHRTKLQRWLFASIGLILVALVLNFIWFKANGGGGSRQSATEQRQQQRQSSNMGAGTSQFGDLVSRQQSRLAERNSFQEQVDEAAGELKTTGQQAWSQFQGREDTSKASQGKAREPSAEQKAYAKWRSEERMRALKSAQSPWGYTDAVAKAQRGGAGGGRCQSRTIYDLCCRRGSEPAELTDPGRWQPRSAPQGLAAADRSGGTLAERASVRPAW